MKILFNLIKYIEKIITYDIHFYLIYSDTEYIFFPMNKSIIRVSNIVCIDSTML